jgi:1-phosphofructokinase family hexose kinase
VGRITTVTLNPALDEAVALESLVLGGKNRCSLDALDPGGKGVNASRVISRLGRSTIALGFAGGLTGDFLREKLQAEGVSHRFVTVAEATRVNIMIYEYHDGRRSRLYLPGPTIAQSCLRELELQLDAVEPGSVVIFGGSVPPGIPASVYRDLIRRLKSNGVQSVVDTSGAALAAALEAAPAIIKPNVEEASELLGRALPDDDAVLAAAREFQSMGAQRVVISQAAAGAICVEGSNAWKAVPPAVQSRATVGSGDSMVAGLAIGLDENCSITEGLRLGTAAGAATAMVSGTSLCRARDVAALLPRVTVGELTAVA